MSVGLYKRGTGKLKIFEVNKLQWALDNGYVTSEKEAMKKEKENVKGSLRKAAKDGTNKD